MQILVRAPTSVYFPITMSLLLELIILGSLICLMYHLFFEFRSSNNLPPGPRPWPLIGNLGHFTKDLHVSLTTLGKEYGEVFRLYIGHRPIIVLSGKAIREAFVRQPRDFAGRLPRPSYLKETGEQGPGIALLDYGPEWKLFRKLGHSTIKVYGEDRLQKVIYREVDELCKRLEEMEGQPIDISKQFGMSVTNIICSKIFGTRYELDDPEFIQVYDMHKWFIQKVHAMGSLINVVPFLKYFLPESDIAREDKRLRKVRYALLRKKYLQHVEDFDEENIRDYTDALLKAKKDAEDEDKSGREYFKEDSIINAGLATLFIAGSETTATTLGWATIYLLHHPELQGRLHREITAIVGQDATPKLSQRKELPILEAFTAETLRLANLAPISIPHKTTNDVTLLGYNIPKGTAVLPNLWSLHHDPSIWEEPFKFNIDRFLDEDGNFLAPDGGSFLPFSTGPRMCPGEVLARSELFLFLSRLLQRFELVNPPGCELPSLEGDLGVVLHYKPFKVCVKIRK